MYETPRGNRLHIALFGRTNAGKSSLINALTKQEIALVSETPGTTTDPVYKAMEILPIGPVMIIDTAGMDDEGQLGKLRMEKTMQVLAKTDVALLVIEAQHEVNPCDQELLMEIKKRKIPVIGVVSKVDQITITKADEYKWEKLFDHDYCKVSALYGSGIEELKRIIIKNTPLDWEQESIVGDLLSTRSHVVLVVPIDHAAPKGRLILPQVQTIRDILDHHAICSVLKVSELKDFIENVNRKPDLIITDSQAFSEVANDTPQDIALTSFSILFARFKGDLKTYVKGLQVISTLHPGDSVLIAEGCTHHRQEDDIGTVKIPRWLDQYVGGKLEYTWTAGNAFPKDLKKYRCVIHCGACMMNRREVLYRLSIVKEAGVPIVNYGMLIAYLKGILPRALEPFHELRDLAERLK